MDHIKLTHLLALPISFALAFLAHAERRDVTAPAAASSVASPTAPLDCDMRHMDMPKMTMDEHMRIMQACRQQQRQKQQGKAQNSP